jgi:hypothetical protein
MIAEIGKKKMLNQLIDYMKPQGLRGTQSLAILLDSFKEKDDSLFRDVKEVADYYGLLKLQKIDTLIDEVQMPEE